MLHDDILSAMRQSAAIKLLQSQNAPLIIGFLHDQFKQQQQVKVAHGRLLTQLSAYLDALHESYPDRYGATAATYLRQWCDEEHRFLRRYYEARQDEPVYELTPDTERALNWVSELQRQTFVGTESRFLRIFDLLQEIVTYSTEDPTVRLQQLEQEKSRIQAEIDAIVSTGHIEQYSATQIKERFFEANDVARRLLGDFREVEENFRIIARQVQEQQLMLSVRKGQIVAHVLDADQTLKESDQGRSFYAFWEFLISAQRQELLQELLGTVYRQPDLQQLDAGRDYRLRRLKRNLIEAASAIVASNRRLGEQLRKLLDEQNLAEARRVAELATEIKQLAISVVGDTPADPVFYHVEGDPALMMPLSRPLWQAPQQTRFDEIMVEPAAESLALADLAGLFAQFHIDEDRLRRQLETILEQQATVTLAEMVEHFPLEKGLAEIMTYFTMAVESDRHHVAEERTESLLLQPSGRRLFLPEITFRR